MQPTDHYVDLEVHNGHSIRSWIRPSSSKQRNLNN